MKAKMIFIALAIFVAIPSFSQELTTDMVSKKEISKLGFMVGSWKGEGWMMGRDRQKMEFVQTEEIQFKLDTTTLMIEGLGRHKDVVTHNALAIISYNKESGDYGFQSYLQNGRKGEFNREGNWYQFFEMTLDKI